MDMIKVLFLIAVVGHLLCGYCDVLLTYIPGGEKFDFTKMKSNEAMAKTFVKMPLRNPRISMVLGIFALLMEGCGFYGLCLWMKQFSTPASIVMLIGAALFLVMGTAHHVLCGVAEWIYVKMGCTDEAREAVVKLFKDTSITMIVCYIGLFVLGVMLFVQVVTGATDLPIWACIINIIPLYMVTLPLRVGGMGNWCGAIMFIGLLILI